MVYPDRWTESCEATSSLAERQSSVGSSGLQIIGLTLTAVHFGEYRRNQARLTEK